MFPLSADMIILDAMRLLSFLFSICIFFHLLAPGANVILLCFHTFCEHFHSPKQSDVAASGLRVKGKTKKNVETETLLRASVRKRTCVFVCLLFVMLFRSDICLKIGYDMCECLVQIDSFCIVWTWTRRKEAKTILLKLLAKLQLHIGFVKINENLRSN